MQKNFTCLICGENISIQIDLNKLNISTDCKNRHHFREIPLNDFYKFLPQSKYKENNNNEFILYCFICHKNVDLANIGQHNGHDRIELSLNEFLSKRDCIEFNKNIMKNNFDNQLNKIEKIIKDYTNWKNKFDTKFNILIKFFETLYQLEKNIFNNIITKNKNQENYFDYELLTNIKEIYRINKDINNDIKNYEGLFNNNNFDKLSYFIINKIKDINEQNEIYHNDINIFYKDNKCFFNEEIKYKKEMKDISFPYIILLFKNCKHLIGYDSRYFDGNSENKNPFKLNNKIFQQFLLKIKRQFPNINHLSHMRNKSYLLCSIEKKINIIKTNLFNAKEDQNFEMTIIKTIDSFHYDDISDILFSLELTNRLLLSISAHNIYIYESFINEENNEDDFYKNYFLQKKFIIKNKIDDIIQISSNFFCTYSFILMEIHFYDISNMEIVTKIGGVEGTPECTKYFTMIKNNLLLFAGMETIFIISTKDMKIKAQTRTNGLVSSFCLLPNNGLLCGQIIIDYGPNNPWKKGDNKNNLVQYQIAENQIKKISEKISAHNDFIRSLYYFDNNIIISCTNKDELKIWY